ncbi:MAG: cytochrome c [Cyclobacteriaceae bacterium]
MRKPIISLFSLLFIFLISCERFTPEEKAELSKGEEVYITHCISCHGPSGDGLNGAYPSLLKPQFTETITDNALNIIRHGSAAADGMKAVSLSDEELVQVVNYIQNNWSNEAPLLSQSNLKSAQKL